MFCLKNKKINFELSSNSLLSVTGDSARYRILQNCCIESQRQQRHLQGCSFHSGLGKKE